MVFWANQIRVALALPQKENGCKNRQNPTGTIFKLAFGLISSRWVLFLSQCSECSVVEFSLFPEVRYLKYQAVLEWCNEE